MIQELAHEVPHRAVSGASAVLGGGGNLVRFWELRGRPVFEAQGVWWGHHRGPFYTSLPFQLQVDIGPEEAREVLQGARVWGLSFPSPRSGLPGGHYVIRPQGYDLGTISRKQRGHVTRGLEDCELRLLDADELLRLGLPLNRETLTRQMREDDTFEDPAKWKAFVKAVAQCPGMVIHGAFVDGRLATYLISCRDGQWLHLIYKMSTRAEQDHYPNHALDFSIIRDAAADPGIRFIGNGMTSILPNEGLDRYKRQLGYQLEPHNLSIHIHPWLGPLLNTGTALAWARKAQDLFPDNARLGYYSRILEGARLSRLP
ncbi:GNAT family N-acetyltransferase [Geothrix fermentans]|uniref:GNAT family N-acetyltransferase n=1 Tax=Geothrix fermentans TaxID=44676 RepID=UPI00041F5155|nr:GNAT family N-acetyltransferase [Geothrix fermentans]